MLFNSIEFIYFLPLVIIAYYLTPHRFRWVLLLLASYVFYMFWKVEYIFLIVASTLIDFYAAKRLEASVEKKQRKKWLLLSLCTNLGLLFTFKYFNFFTLETEFAFQALGLNINLPQLKWLLPVGISFYTFQTLSYTIDVYYNRVKAETHLGYFALYVSFFPQLVAGPIERYSRLSPQLKTYKKLKYENISKGFRLILYGLFAKMVVADNLAVYVEQVYAKPETMSSLDISLGMVFYSFQIYGDFYGYSLVAIGSALLLGIKIMDNFKTPYLAQNIAEFWQRWHISLSTWFRDYLYYPLGGNKASRARWALNIMVVFVVSGLWHGANWTFLIWGALFGIVYLLEKIIFQTDSAIKNTSYGVWNVILSLKTFLIVTVIWVFFRSQNWEHAKGMFYYLLNNVSLDSGLSKVTPPILIFFVLFIISDIVLYNTRFDKALDKVPFVIRWFLYSILLFAIIVFAGIENYPFIYFQF